MKAAQSQEKVAPLIIPEPRLVSPVSDQIEIPAATLSTADAVVFRDRLTEVINCNVATRISKMPAPTVKTLWDSINDPKVTTIDVDNKIANDFQQLLNCGESLDKVVLGLIDFYSDADSLNVILLSDLLVNRPSYTKYTNQFALTLRNSQEKYETIKVQYDRSTSRVGIFCRKAGIIPIRSSFIQSLVDHLLHSHILIIPLDKLPQTYRTNFATLKYQLKNLIPNKKISVEKSEKDVTIRILT